MSLRYRVGIDRVTGQLLVGWPHCAQSVAVILTTQLGERVMRLDFGSDPHGVIGEELHPRAVARFYADCVKAIHAHEPEYRIVRVQVVSIARTGALALKLEGTYFPEGRYGNYAVREAAASLLPFAGVGRVS